MIKKYYNFFKKFNEIFLPLILFFIALSFCFKTYDSCQIKIALLNICGAVLFFIFFSKNLIKILKFFETFDILYLKDFFHPIIFSVFLFLLYSFFSCCISQFKIVSIEELMRRLCYFLVFISIALEFYDIKILERLIFLIILANFITSLYGLIQILGLDPFIWKGAFGSRIFSTFGNPNFFSAYLVWTTPIVFSYILYSKKYVYLFIVLVSLLDIFYTQSKASYIGIIFAIFVFLVLYIKYFLHKNINLYTKIKKYIVIFFILFSTGVILGLSFLINKRFDSIKFRLLTWRSTLNMINKPIFVNKAQSIILGTGIGTFRAVYPSYRDPGIFFIEGDKHNTATEHPENEFLEVLYESGILGFGLFLLILFLIFYYFVSFLQILDKEKDEIYIKPRFYLIGIISGLIGMLVHNLMCVNMRFVSSGVYFWTMLGMIYSIVRLFEKKKNVEIDNFDKKISFFIFYFFIVIFFLFACFFIKKSVDIFLADIHLNRGIYFSKNQMYDKGKKEYKKAISLDKRSIMSYYFLGNLFIDENNQSMHYDPFLDNQDGIPRNNYMRALEMYDKVKSIAPNYVQVHFLVGNIYYNMNEYDKAIENYEKYLALDPVLYNTYLNLANIYYSRNDYKKGDELIETALKYNFKSSDVYFNFANFYYLNNNVQKAKDFFKKAIELDDNNIQAYKNLIYIYSVEKDKKNFNELGKKLVSKLPKNDEFVRVFKEEKIDE